MNEWQCECVTKSPTLKFSIWCLHFTIISTKKKLLFYRLIFLQVFSIENFHFFSLLFMFSFSTAKRFQSSREFLWHYKTSRVLFRKKKNFMHIHRNLFVIIYLFFQLYSKSTFRFSLILLSKFPYVKLKKMNVCD